MNQPESMQMEQSGSPAWWRRSVVYQVYIRSFADGNGDGTGDLAGLRARLDHLAELGIDAIWVNPWYPSPMADGGYDVVDHRAIHLDFGTLAEADALISETHERGMRFLIDVVPNHTSVEHPWFQAALAAGSGSPERQRYIFRAGRGPGGDEPPTNWQAVFGGSAWTRVDDGEWYLHIFDISQPDLNWQHPEVRDEFDSILRFWVDRDVDGFRVDVAHGMVKDRSFPDAPVDLLDDRGQRLPDGSHPHWDRDELHQLIRRWRAVLDEYDNRMMVAEANVHPDRLPLYLRPGEYHQSFNFDLLKAKWSADDFRSIIVGSAARAAAIGAVSTWVLSNHDIVRHATRYGLPPGIDYERWLLDGPHDVLDAEAGARRARAAVMVTLALPGSTYIYQGDELGLPEVWDLPVEVLEDPTWERSKHTVKGRDGCRVPIPWAKHGSSFGFGEGPSWLPQPPIFGDLSVEAQKGDPASTLNLYRSAIRLRGDLFVADEELDMLDLGVDILAFRRGSGATVVVNMGSTPLPADDLPPGEIVLSSGPTIGTKLPPDAAVWLAPES
ncbi:MAG: glycoside hydrolase family 13 protein [Acidimicrobiia bacterium]|nr:glycoside hydrolase family 13 protein [Acidimicrobiia bacterium]